MKFSPTSIPQLYIVELEPRTDERGFLARAWCSRELSERGLTGCCLQANLVWNGCRGTLRGMHIQLPPHADAKFLRVIRGRIHDVVLDLRQNSPTFGKWFACELSAENRRALFIPEGCAHGYLTLTDDTELLYLHSSPYQPECSAGVHWQSYSLEMAWPFPPTVISEKDQNLPHELW